MRHPAAQSASSCRDEEWNEAVRRAKEIRPLVEAPRAGRRAAVQAAATRLGFSVSRVYSLIRQFRNKPLTESMVRHKPGPAQGTRRLAPELECVIEKAIDGYYLQPERPTQPQLLKQIRHDCRAAGLKPPSLKAVRARITARNPRERARKRDGAAVTRDRFRPVKRGLHTEKPLQIVQVDSTRVDIMLVDKEGACIGRPWVTFVLDIYTRMVIGLYLSLDPPSASGAGLALVQAMLSKHEWLSERSIDLDWPAKGVPEIVHVDNGTEFRSRAFERGCEQHGMRIHYSPPAEPRYRGHIERLMGTVMSRIHALPGTTFSSVADRGDYASEQRATMSFHAFERFLALEVLGSYHNEVHSALGCSPAAAWRRGVASFEPQMPPDPAQLLLDFLPFEIRAVNRHGIRLFNIFYQDGALAHVVDGGGAKLPVKYDPRDLSAVFVERPGGDYVRVPYADLGRPPITLWEHRKAERRRREEGRRTVDEHAIFTAREEQRRLMATERENSKQARRAAVRVQLARRAATASPTETTTAAVDGPDAKVPVPPEEDPSGVEFW